MWDCVLGGWFGEGNIDEALWSAWLDESPVPPLDTATGFPLLLNAAVVGVLAGAAAPFPSLFP